MGKRVIRVGDKCIPVAFVVYFEERPGTTLAVEGEDEFYPHLLVQLLGNVWQTVTEQAAVAAGYQSIGALRDAIIAAIDELP